MKTAKATIEAVQNGYILACDNFKKVATSYERMMECLAESLGGIIPCPEKKVTITISAEGE